MPAVGKVPEFKGYDDVLSPREWLAQSRSKFPVPANLQAEDGYVRRFHGGGTHGLGQFCLEFRFLKHFSPLFPWARVESSLMSHFGRAESPEVLLALLNAHSLESAGGITRNVSQLKC
jgi:hypothetical protein